MGFFGRKPPLHGETDWAGDGELARVGAAWSPMPAPNSFVVGTRQGARGTEYLCLLEGHIGLFAATGTGKDRNFVIPNIFASTNTLLVFDPKGENFRYCAGRLQQSGFEVYRFDPSAPEGRTHRYNPLGYVRRWYPGGERHPDCFDDIQRIAYTHIPELDNSDKARFWDDAARDAFIGVTAVLAETPGINLTLANVLRVFSRADGPQLMSDYVQRARASGLHYSQAAVDAVSDYLNGSHEQVNGIRKSVTTKLALFRSPRVAAATDANDFDLRELRNRPMAVFVTCNAEKALQYRSLLSLLFQQAINLNAETEFGHEPSHRFRVTVIFNEMWMLGKMAHIASGSSFLRGYGFRLAYVTQSKAQIRDIFGEEAAKNLFANTRARMIFGASDWELCKEYSEQSGFDTVSEVTISRPRFFGALKLDRQQESESARRRSLILPQEVEAIPAHMALSRHPGKINAKFPKLDWLSDPLFRDLPLPPPYIPEIAASVPLDDGAAPLVVQPAGPQVIAQQP
jgi:type IV secretion system protein VirD4